jgi:hypothetical protein
MDREKIHQKESEVGIRKCSCDLDGGASAERHLMKIKTIAKCLLASTVVVFSSGCLMQQTVTENGEVTSSNYVIKRPIKELIENSQ